MASRNPKQIRKEVNRVNREVKRAIQARILNAPDDTKHLFPAVLRQDPAQWTVIPDTLDPLGLGLDRVEEPFFVYRGLGNPIGYTVLIPGALEGRNDWRARNRLDGWDNRL